MQLVMQIQIYKNRTHKITYILPIRNWFKFARTKRIINNDKWAAETTSSGSEFQINQIKSNMTLIMVDKPQPSYNLLNVMK